MAFLTEAANRGSIATGYEIDNSLKLEVANGEGIWRVTDTTSNRRTFTCSMWFKTTEILTQNRFLFGSYLNSTNLTYIRQSSTGKLQFRGHPGTGNKILTSVAVFADTSAWYHLVLAVDTTQSTAANRVKIYINGEQIELTGTYPAQNEDQQINLVNNKTNIGFMQGYYDTSFNFCGYIAEAHFVDGTQYAASDFGEYDEDSGIWIPKQADVTYGSQGFYVNFDNSSSLGADSSGNSNTLSLQNITAADQATDTPTNNFCTINPLINYYGSVSEGATKWLHTAGGDGWESFVATMGAGTSGKWYAEFKFVDSDNDNFIGICPIDDPDLNRGADHFAYYGADTSLDESVGYYASNGQRYIGGGGSAYGNTWARTNIMSIAVDMDNGKLYFAKDGVWQNSGDPTSGATGTGALDVRGATKPQSLGASNYTSGEDILANYGGFTTISISSAASDANGYGTFEYAPPSGYYALCTKNLAEYG